MRCKHLCPWCEMVLEAEAPDFKEADNREAYAALGEAIINQRLLHVIMECREVENA